MCVEGARLLPYFFEKRFGDEFFAVLDRKGDRVMCV